MMKTKSKTFVSEALTSLKDETIDIIEESVDDKKYIVEEVYSLIDQMMTLAHEAADADLKSIQFVLEDAVDALVERINLIDYSSEDELIEAMSPEDENDSRILKNIYSKTSKRANSALTPEEKEVLKKYNLDREGGFDRRTRVYNIDTNDDIIDGSNRYSRNHNKINFADRARKVPERRKYKNYIGNTWYSGWTPNDDEADKALKDKTRYSSLAKANARDMSADYRELRRALKSNRSTAAALADIDSNYEKRRKEINDKYREDLYRLYRLQQSDISWEEDKNKAAIDTIDNIKKKHNM